MGAEDAVAIDTGLRSRWRDSAYIDMHCHRTTAKDMLEIVSIDTLDFSPAAMPGGFYTLGMHPWHIGRQDKGAALATIAAAAEDPNLLGIGECGLDKCIGTPLTLQLAVFDSQIVLAERLGKPLIIHCVRAFNELLAIKKGRKTQLPWIVHGFQGNPVLAGQLLKQGFYLSLGKALLDKGDNARRVLAAMPLERLFLETDTADAPIGAIYAAAAKILGLEVKAMQTLILGNFQRVFIHD